MARRATEDDIRRIYRDTIDDLYGFVARRSNGERELAEDVTQETWLRAVHAWRRDGVPERPLAWLTTVAGRLLSNHFRRPRVVPLEESSAEAVAAHDGSGSRERRNLVEIALARLPRMQSRLLEAFHFDRRPVAEIASSLGLTERGVEGRLRRARQNLRREIESDPKAMENEP
jgi:RNA polymerase sigma-70 factor (ECF subfamily)